MMKIGEVFCLIRNGASIKQSNGASGIPITRIETISNRTVDRNKFGYANIANAAEYQDYLLQDGDILMSHINSEKHLGKTALYRKYSDEQIIHGMNLLLLRPNTEILLPDYAMYFLNSEVFLRQLPRITRKSVNQASFNISALKELDVYVPSINRQKEIVSVLDKVDAMLERYKTQFKRLDDLVKSRFVEMFGDRNYPHTALINLIKDGMGLSYGIVQPGDDGTGEMGVLRPVDMVDGKISMASIKYIDRSIGDGFRKTELTGDELLITVRGTTGVTALTDIRFAGMNVTRGIAVIRYDREKINPVYLNAYLNTDESQRYIQEHTRGATLQQINLSDLCVQEVVVPPTNLQNRFAAFVAEVDKSKLAVQQSLEKLETLKKSLMQQYFG